MAARWATFDCYGTLVDWNAGIGAELGRLFGSPVRERLLARYHVIEPRPERALDIAGGAALGLAAGAAVTLVRHPSGDEESA